VNRAAAELGRRGGKATARKRTQAQRTDSATKAGRARWDLMSPEQQAAQLERMRAGRKPQEQPT
jgi:hypothetical protein